MPMYDPLPVIARFFICLALCLRAHHAFAVEAATGELRGPGLVAPSGLSLPVPRTLDLTHIDPAAFAAALGKDGIVSLRSCEMRSRTSRT